MSIPQSYFLETLIVCLELRFEGDVLSHLSFFYERKKQSTFALNAKQALYVKQIERYFKHAQSFNVPLVINTGTPFQRRVWQALCAIPVGQTRTYGELAKQLKTSARSIGMACRSNPIALIVPCHRVVGAKDAGGFCGHQQGKPIAVKEWLLAHEATQVKAR
ncbi:methylated-DNA--[protein]-cysteine S-methyltransferase [Candidatus Berkiella aquae]|uniref:methylated-DNA--[protein]-cysteine S-methyltransferase n=1 Tax=Candidatus Berkiella aquae TaxID=295108 RepID=A0A0Q9Z028_9GAMM|nr:methylated-DNA--[protein]-cysteine S-methyltransferase [Candidatus Berkiella aquae]MCS5712430.1 methylated-DNA--[protein]-cysteine S-methyltransferase [Candidatus Berkiella aquae]